MNNSPDAFKALAAEKDLANSTAPPEKADLTADWQLKHELRQFETPVLPAKLRARVLEQTSRRRRPAWWVGLAAAIILALGVGLIHQTSEQTNESLAISDSDLQQLKLALATLDDSARRTGNIAGRELAANLTMPNVNLDQLPYGQALRQWTQPPKPET